jgi:hypothetical protein
VGKRRQYGKGKIRCYSAGNHEGRQFSAKIKRGSSEKKGLVKETLSIVFFILSTWI